MFEGILGLSAAMEGGTIQFTIAAAVDSNFRHSHYYFSTIIFCRLKDATSVFLTFPPSIGGGVRQTCAELLESDHFNL